MTTTTAGIERWRVYDRPELQAGLGPEHAGRRQIALALDGVHCGGCVSRIERLIGSRVGGLRINLAARTASFDWQPGGTPLSEILATLDTAGFTPRVLAAAEDADQLARERRRSLARIGVAVICAMQVMMLAWPGYFGITPPPDIDALLRYAQWLLATPCVLWSGAPFFRNAWRALRQGQLDMDVPVALSLAGAYGLSAVRTLLGGGELYFDTATMFVAILLGGRFLESRTRAIASERLRRLAGARPMTAQRRRGADIETVPVDALQVGDEVLVPGGERLPVDGTLLDARAELDESLLSGESTPVLRSKGDTVHAGSLHVGDERLLLRATAVGPHTQLAAITALLDRGQQAPAEAPLQKLAMRIARHLVAGILLLSAAGALWAAPRGFDAALSVALAVLVASCPCALSLAVPAALAAASGRLATRGVLVADAQALLQLGHVDTVLFDKTGTLTEPRLQLLDTFPLADRTPDQCRAIAAALERGSRHPIAQAFAGIATQVPVDGLRHVPGQGAQGRIAGQQWTLSAPRDADGEGLETVIELCCEQLPIARFRLAAPARRDAEDTVRELQRRGLRVELLSGDAAAPTENLARQFNIRDWRARCTPAEKLERLRALRQRGSTLLAVGDGLNDAPFLAAADVAAALPHGAALTQSRAGLILVGDKLSALPESIDIALRMNRRLRENFAWALGYNLAVLPLALGGWLSPWLAAIGMSASSILVCVNALRLGGAQTAAIAQNAR